MSRNKKNPAGGGVKSPVTVAVSQDDASDADREFVLRLLQRLVACGVAEWTVLESGDIRLRLDSGAVFNLGRDGVTRLA